MTDQELQLIEEHIRDWTWNYFFMV